MKIESDSLYFTLAADVVLRTAITQTMFAELASMQAFKHMQAVKLVADAYELHCYFVQSPESGSLEFAGEWTRHMTARGCISKHNGTDGYKAYDPKGRYCGRLSAANGRATIINWRS